jgi:hypothetical protein
MRNKRGAEEQKRCVEGAEREKDVKRKEVGDRGMKECKEIS